MMKQKKKKEKKEEKEPTMERAKRPIVNEPVIHPVARSTSSKIFLFQNLQKFIKI